MKYLQIRPAKQTDINRIKNIEKSVYPNSYVQMDWVDNIKDLGTYCEGKPFVLLLKNGYLLVTKKEIVDFVSKEPLSLSGLLVVYKSLKSFFKNRKVTTDLRAKTSYKLLKFLEKKRKVKIFKKEKYTWSGEYFFEVKFKFL